MDTNPTDLQGSDQDEVFVPVIELPELIELKNAGDWAKIKELIENGQVDILPVNLIKDFAASKSRLDKLTNLLQALVNVTKPLSEKSDQLNSYLDHEKEGYKKIRFMRIAQELMGALPALGMGNEVYLPLFELLKSGLDFSGIKEMDSEEMLQLLDESGIDYKSVEELCQKLKLFPSPTDNI